MIWRRIRKSTKKEEEEFSEMMEEVKPSAKDKFAMVLAAFLTIVLPCLIILVVLSLIVLFIFGAFR